MGRFIFAAGTADEQIINNTLTREGENALLQILFQGNNTIVVGTTGNFYLGLCGDVFTLDTTLATLGGEPTVTAGYARQAILRSAAGWPTLVQLNGVWMARSTFVTFTPTGAGFNVPIQRAFICTAASGSAGKLIAVSGPLAAPLALPVGVGYPVEYEFYLST